MSLSEGYLKIVQLCNGFSISNNRNRCRPFLVEDKQIGLIIPEVFQYLHNYSAVFHIEPPADGNLVETVRLNPNLKTYEERSEKLALVLQELRQRNVFSTLKGWRNETHDVWHKYSEPPVLKIERSALGLFGAVQYGVHVNGYYRHPKKGLFMWVAKRSMSKSTWPGKLDNMVAGGIHSGESVIECAKRECQEEASVPSNTLQQIRSVNCITFFYEDQRGLLPEVQFMYDLEVPEDFIPENADGEVERFKVYPIAEVKELITKDNFKFTCAIVVIDFLIRHGEITPDDEPNYAALVKGMHRTLEYGT